jgi:signal transduction histidine kinase
VSDSPSIRLLAGRVSPWVNLAGLAFLIAGLAAFNLEGPAIVLLAVAAAAWLVWTAAVNDLLPNRLLSLSTGVMAAAGGALTAFAGLAMVFPAVAAMSLTINRPFRRAAWILVVGPAAAFIALAATDHHYGLGIGTLSAVLTGAVLGVSRREAQERVAESARTEMLAQRNHLARELHDVLAHTLSALSLQLEALSALMGDRPVEPAVAAQLNDIRRLVREGLEEAKGAVAALREDLPPLDERLAKLAAERHAAIELSGPPRDLPPDVSLALYRVAQEALTNAAKHAPGAASDVHLDYGDKEVTLAVSNPPSPSPAGPPDTSGGGYGLQGIRERVLLLGGAVDAGPHDGGWRVEARVPA